MTNVKMYECRGGFKIPPGCMSEMVGPQNLREYYLFPYRISPSCVDCPYCPKYAFSSIADIIKGSKNEPLYEGDYSCSFILTEYEMW